MTAVEGAVTPRRSVGSRPTGGARARRRLSRGHWVALVVGAVAALVNVAVLRDRSATVDVAVAREAIPAATPVTAGMVEVVAMPADSPVSSAFVRASTVAGGKLVTTRAVPAGEPVTTSSVAEDLPTGGRRSMSIPVDVEHAAGGELRPGDVVDVIDVVDGQSQYVATGVQVVTVGEPRAGSLGEAPEAFHVVVAVDADEALRVASALSDDRVEVVRATGAEPVASGAGSVRVGPAEGGP